MTWDTERKELGRRPFQYVEMDMDYCAQTYGVAPCNAKASFQVDSFTDADATAITDHTTDGGLSWVSSASTYTPSISSNELVIQPDAGVASFVLDDAPGSANQFAEMKVRLLGAALKGDFLEVVARQVVTNSYYYLQADFQANKIYLGKEISGGRTTLGSFATTFTSGSTYKLKIDCTGTTITGYLDDIAIISATDSDITIAGDVGFRADSQSWADSYIVETPVIVVNLGSDLLCDGDNIMFALQAAIANNCLPSDVYETNTEARDSVEACIEALTYNCPSLGHSWLLARTGPTALSYYVHRDDITPGSGVLRTLTPTLSNDGPKTGITMYLDDFSTNGVTPVTSNACFNTRATCQYPNAYSATTKTYRFCEDTVDAPHTELDGQYCVPEGSIRLDPTRITPGKGLGWRASIKIPFNDFAHHDRGIDPYVASRAYVPEEQGTFFGKWLARNQYYAGRTIRLYSGFLTDTFSVDNFQLREYRIEKIDGPDKNGRVTVTCKDILKELDNAVAPTASQVYLASGISDSATTIPINTDGEVALAFTTADGTEYFIDHVGGYFPFYDSTGASKPIALDVGLELPFYDAASSYLPIPLTSKDFVVGGSVRVRIGSELIDGTYQPGQIESATRGAGGSSAAAHSANDSVQFCIIFDDEIVTDALKTILAYAGIGESLINTTTWDEQADKWLGLTRLTGTISKPTKVKDLIERISDQGTVYIWWDERTQKVELRAIAPQANVDTLDAYSDDYNFIFDSIDIKRDLKDQVTQVWTYYDKINDADGNDPDNMAALYVSVDADAESAAQWNRVKPKELNAEFVRNSGHAATIASRTTGRLRDGELTAKFELDAKDADLWTGDEFLIQSDSLQAADGSRDSIRMQVVEVNEAADGKYAYMAQKSVFQGKRYAYIAPDTVSASYAAATDDERNRYAFIGDINGYMSDGTTGYLII